LIFTVTFLILINVGIYLYFKKRNDLESALLAEKLESSLELKQTLAMGLYLRFNYPRTKKEDGSTAFDRGSEIFIKQLPYEFEDFVASVIKKRFGGDVFVTSRSGDFGVDFEHITEKGLFLGQAKVYKEDVNFEPIAILHSNMVKQNAVGGYIITTSGYTKAAKEYAKELNIELINGVALVEYWLGSIDNTVYSLSNELV
jgi:restriction system protein